MKLNFTLFIPLPYISHTIEKPATMLPHPHANIHVTTMKRQAQLHPALAWNSNQWNRLQPSLFLFWIGGPFKLVKYKSVRCDNALCQLIKSDSSVSGSYIYAIEMEGTTPFEETFQDYQQQPLPSLNSTLLQGKNQDNLNVHSIQVIIIRNIDES